MSESLKAPNICEINLPLGEAAICGYGEADGWLGWIQKPAHRPAKMILHGKGARSLATGKASHRTGGSRISSAWQRVLTPLPQAANARSLSMHTRTSDSCGPLQINAMPSAAMPGLL